MCHNSKQVSKLAMSKEKSNIYFRTQPISGVHHRIFQFIYSKAHLKPSKLTMHHKILQLFSIINGKLLRKLLFTRFKLKVVKFYHVNSHLPISSDCTCSAFKMGWFVGLGFDAIFWFTLCH
jgi:hypothetical protein